MPTLIRKPIKIESPSRDYQTSDSQIDKIDHDLFLLDITTNPPKELLIEIRRDIDDYSQRLNKLQKRLTEVVEDHDKLHKKY